MKEKLYQLTIVFMFTAMVVIYSSFSNYLEEEKQFYHRVVKDLGLQIVDLKEEVEKKEEKYHKTLTNIAENIKRNDSFLNIGGYKEDMPYDDNEYYEKILTGSSDFDKLLTDMENFFEKRSEYLSKLPNIWPVKKSPLNRITSAYGSRFNPFNKKLTQHNGIDIAGPWRAPVIATADGVVKHHWIFHSKFGRMIIIQHENNYRTVYAHLAESYIHEGYEVKKGEVIGVMGKSGKTQGIHVHYEVRKDGKAVNPINYLRSQVE